MISREMVAEFMRHIGSETPTVATDRGSAMAGTRFSLLMEELLETHTAMLRGDLIETADGLADLKYVIVGCAVAYGLPIQDFFLIPSIEPKMPDTTDAISLTLACMPALCDVAVALAGDGGLSIALKALDIAVSQEAAHLGIPLQEIFAEVHASNMTKEPGYRIGAAKYGLSGGKGSVYRPPDIRKVLVEAGWLEKSNG